MNKKAALLVLSALLLAGCSGAQTSVTDGTANVMTVGDVSIDAETEYDLIKQSSGPNYVMQLAEKAIYTQEVPVDDDIQKEAEERWNEYAKTSSSLEEYIQSLGYADKADYIDQVLVPAVQAEKLLSKYFTDNADALIEEYKPSKASIIQTDSEDSAQKALDALKDGKSPEDVAEQYGAEGASYDGETVLVTTSDTALPTRLINSLATAESVGTLNEVFSDDAGTNYYVAVLVTNDYEDLKSELESTLSNDSSVMESALIYYLTKYDFQVYDQDIFDYLKANYPQYLVTRPDLME